MSRKTNNLDITAVTIDENAEFIISGDKDVKDGSIVKITVKAEDGTINTYNINIEVSNSLNEYIIYIILGSVLLIGIIALVIVNRKPKTKTKKGTDSNTPKQIKKTVIPTPVVNTVSKPEPVPAKPVVAPVTKEAVDTPKAVEHVIPIPVPQAEAPVTKEAVGTPKAVEPVIPIPVPQAEAPKENVEVLDL